MWIEKWKLIFLYCIPFKSTWVDVFVFNSFPCVSSIRVCLRQKSISPRDTRRITITTTTTTMRTLSLIEHGWWAKLTLHCPSPSPYSLTYKKTPWWSNRAQWTTSVIPNPVQTYNVDEPRGCLCRRVFTSTACVSLVYIVDENTKVYKNGRKHWQDKDIQLYIHRQTHALTYTILINSLLS